MGGDVTVESEVAVGSTFTFSAPLRRTTSDDLEQAPAGVREAPDLELKVLAAEDNATNQLVLKTLLGAAGISPTIVSNGAEAVEAWRGGDWDVILMDVQMPVMDGLAATMEIRKQEAAEGRARSMIVALTANAMDHHVQEYLSVGMDDFLAKPISVDKLFALLTTVQSVVSAQRELVTPSPAMSSISASAYAP